MRKATIHKTNLYRVRSRFFWAGWVLAHSESDAIEVAIGTGLHRRGKPVQVWATVPGDELNHLREGKQRGRLYYPTPFYKHFVLITPNELD